MSGFQGQPGGFNLLVSALQEIGRGMQQIAKAITGGISVSNTSLPSYTVATLPVAGAGTMAFATDGRDVGQGPGLGTGCVVVRKAGIWVAVWSGAAVTT